MVLTMKIATEFKPFKLSKIVEVSHNTKKFIFELQTPETILGLPVGQHITLRYGTLYYQVSM